MQDDPFRAFMPYPAMPVSAAVTGPLAGLTLAVKDVLDIAGYPTSCGNPLKLAVSCGRRHTASSVQRLLDAGARFVGKTHTDELGYSLSGKNNHFGTPLNPVAPSRIPGGSSSGSAVAVAGRLADIALGSDTGGSVRAPASYCGLFALRPTHGRLPLDGCMPLAPSFDTIGWFARDAKTLAKVTDVLLGPDSAPLPGAARLLVAKGAFALADAAVGRELEAALRRVELRHGTLDETAEAAPNVDDLYWAFRHIQSREAWESHGAFLDRYAPPLSVALAERFAFGKDVTENLLNEARTVKARFRQHLSGVLGEATVLVLPTIPAVAPLLSDAEAMLEDFRNRALRLLCLSSLSGFPQVTLPLGDIDGAPIGLSLIGPAGSDRSLINLACRIADAGALRVA